MVQQTLSAQHPLSSLYLMSLEQTTSTKETLPSKPTSALTALRKADAIHYWREQALIKSHESTMSGGPVSPIPQCAFQHDRQASSANYIRDYNDVMVVGIVVLFLAAVVVFELMQKVGDM
jgi:hypothetical protein